MKEKAFALLLCFVLAGLSTAGCAGEKTPPDPELAAPAVSGLIDALGLVGSCAGENSAHGGNQSRMVSVSSGTYLGVMTSRAPLQDLMEMSLIRVQPDGSSELLYTDYIATGSTTVTVMADAREDVWLYSAWESGGYCTFNAWRYDVAADRTTGYTACVKVTGGDGFGYSVALMDAGAEKIYGVLSGGDAPGYLLWSSFDLTTGKWGAPQLAETDARYCYHYGFPDGAGGFFLVSERDVSNRAALCDLGIRVSKAIATFHSRKIDADYMWDELHILRVADPAVPAVENLTVEAADYDVQNGLYPNVTNGGGDAFLDAAGRLHILYTADDDGEPGRRLRQKIYDPSDGFREIFSGAVSFAYGEGAAYSQRFYQDTAGTLYLIAACERLEPQIEIWMAEDELGSRFRLAEVCTFPDPVGSGSRNGSLAVANSRNHSTPSDVASLMLYTADSWYPFYVDFAALRQKTG